MRRLVLDSGILGKVCHPLHPDNALIERWLKGLLKDSSGAFRVVVPEITDYELRRKLFHLVRYEGTKQARTSLARLDEFAALADYLPLHTEVMHLAADLWATARGTGQKTADDKALDIDVILAAQVLDCGGQVVTTNRKHLQRFVPVFDWEQHLRKGLV
jgi:predicted nucleic acid-binding protein